VGGDLGPRIVLLGLLAGDGRRPTAAELYRSRPEVRHSRSRERGRHGRVSAGEMRELRETERTRYGRGRRRKDGGRRAEDGRKRTETSSKLSANGSVNANGYEGNTEEYGAHACVRGKPLPGVSPLRKLELRPTGLFLVERIRDATSYQIVA